LRNPADSLYFTLEILPEERRKIRKHDPEAIERADAFVQDMHDIITEIEYLRFIGGLNTVQILEFCQIRGPELIEEELKQFSDYVEIHMTEKSNKQTTKTTLKWVHIAISNAKRTLLGVFHKIKGKYLQNYLNEFCYKLNRRYFGSSAFDRLTLAVAKSYW
jgi:hypothetical protein